MRTIENFIKSDLNINGTLLSCLDRLKGITGFVCVIGDNPRVEIFNRYNHVVRVSNLTQYLASMQTCIYIDQCITLALLHDINRLPFAHLLEKRIEFQQDEYLDVFFNLMQIDVDKDTIIKLGDILHKSTNGSKEASLVFIADCIDGFIEDSLFAFSLFGLKPDDVSDSLKNLLGYFNYNNFKENLQLLNLKFIKNDGFIDCFNKIVLEYSQNFIEIHGFSNIDNIDLDKFHFVRQELKSKLLVSKIFPINNEKISQGNKLYEKFLLPYLESQKLKTKDYIINLFQMTDRQMLADADKKGVLKCKKEELYPIISNN